MLQDRIGQARTVARGINMAERRGAAALEDSVTFMNQLIQARHALGLDSQLVTDGTYFIAEVDGEMVASGGWSYRATLCGSDGMTGREPARLDPATDAAKIRAIFVHPAWARKGLGTLMLEYCEGQAREAGFTRLEMGSTLTGAPLYRLRGYVERERMAIPLPNGEALPVIRMTKVEL